MHGRIKVKTTAEQQEAKKKERAKKLKIYNAGVQKIFAKRANQEYDDEALKISGDILTSNSDFYTLWNFRKEIFLHMKKEKSKEDVQALFLQELYFLECCLKGNPKSYGIWHHRHFVMENIPSPDWTRELQLCNQFLEYDERNFHCWDYRRFVVTKSDVSLTSEFEFTTKKISSNFSNYSSWHYRSKLLPVIFPDPSQPRGVVEGQLLQEHESVQNAYFTDPDDQSAWFYLRWLLGRGELCQKILQMHVSREANRIIVSLNKPIQVGVLDNLVLEMNGCRMECIWKNHRGTSTHSTVWIVKDIVFPPGDVAVHLELEETDLAADVFLSEHKSIASDCYGLLENTFRSELSTATSDVIKRELEGVQELFTIEPDNKWVLLTVVLLMKALSPIEYKDQILEHLQQLIEIDSKRRNYYLDFQSKMLIENTILQLKGNLNATVDLCNLDLSCMAHLELLPLVKNLQLANNGLTSLHNFNYLQCVTTLNIRGNKLTSCEGIANRPELTDLNFEENYISTPDALTTLQTCSKLRTLSLKGNPVCDDEEKLRTIRDMLPKVIISV